MIIVRLKVTRQLTGAFWKEQALGTKDDYGNPFRIIKLRWIPSKHHRNTEYAKTRGFEDAVIGRGGPEGSFRISYRRNGSIEWLRPPGGVGSFYGEVANTPYNLKKLASMYGDGLWTIVDADIDIIVKGMYEKMTAGMNDDVKKFNTQRIMSMHTESVEGDIKLPEGAPIEADKMIHAEKDRANNIRSTELDKKAIELAKKEKELAEREALLAAEGVSPVEYKEEYLKKLKLHELRKLAREMKAAWSNESKIPDLIKAILDVQSGKSALPADEGFDGEEKPMQKPENSLEL